MQYEQESLLHMMETKVNNDWVVLFMDIGSNTSLITHKLAKKLQLRSEPMSQWMEEVGQEVFRHNTSLYYLKLTNKLGTWTLCWATTSSPTGGDGKDLVGNLQV